MVICFQERFDPYSGSPPLIKKDAHTQTQTGKLAMRELKILEADLSHKEYF